MGINLVGPINVDQFQNIINQGFLDWRKLLGPEKITNGTFTGAATGWTLNTGWTYNANAVDRDGAGTATMEQDVSAVVGEIYRVEYQISAYTDGSVTVSIGGTSGTSRSSAATFVEYLKAATTGNLIFTPVAGATFTIDNVSVKKVGYVAADGIAAWIEDRGATAGKGALHLVTEDGTGHVFGDRVGIGTLYPTVAFDVAVAARFGSTVTFAGALAGGDQSWTNVGDMTFATGSIIASGSTNGNTLLLRANDTTFITLTTGATDVCTLDAITMSGTWLASGTVTLPAFTASGNINFGSNSLVGTIWQGPDTSYDRISFGSELGFYTRNLNNLAAVKRLAFSQNVDTAVATWASIYQVGMKFGLVGSATGAWTMDGATSGVVTMTVAAVAGTWTMTLPTGVAGTGGFQLTDAAGDGVCSWSGAGSKREWKNLLDIAYLLPSEALDRILNTRVYPFTFKKGFGTGDLETVYQGILADEAPWAMHFKGGILNPISTFGHTVLAIQALQSEIEDLKARLVSLKG